MKPYFDDGKGIVIYHGDCRDVLTMLDGVDLVLTDPPYGDDHDTDYTRFTGNVAMQSVYPPIDGDKEPFDPRPVLKAGRQTMLCGANRFSDALPVGSWLVWDKRTPTGSKGVMSDAEVIWWSHGRGVYIFSHTWDGFNRASERGLKCHPTQKPVALFRWCMQKARLQPRALILDPYMGSGPVLQAAKQLGYRAIGIDMVERYCAAAAERLQQEVLFSEVPT